MKINHLDLNSPPVFSQFHNTDHTGHKHKTPAYIKDGAAVGSAIGTGAVLACIAKRQGFPIKPSELKNIPIKDWAFFKIAKKGVQNQKLLKIEEGEILSLATGSVAGGLTAGAITDRKNMKAKGREALTQLLGNVLTPVVFVGGTSRIYKKYEKKLKSFMPAVNTGGKNYLELVNKASKNIPALCLIGTALILGISAGNKVTNFINEKMFGQKKIRHIKTSDFAPHVDDLCLAITLAGSEYSKIASTISKTIPLFLSVPGYQVGKAGDKAPNLS